MAHLKYAGTILGCCALFRFLKSFFLPFFESTFAKQAIPSVLEMLKRIIFFKARGIYISFPNNLSYSFASVYDVWFPGISVI